MRYLTTRRSASLAALFATLALAPAQAEVPRVVTDMPITHSLVEMVLQGVGSAELLLDRGADPHSFQLRPSQARAVSQAALLVWMGPDLTPWMDRNVGSLAGGQVLELLSVEGTHRQPYRESVLAVSGAAQGQVSGDSGGHDHSGGHDDHQDHHDTGHGHEHEHEHGDTHLHDDAHAHDDGHDHHHGDLDPHAWLDPHNAGLWLQTIAERLASLDPENGATYRRNAEGALASIGTLEARMEALLAPVGDAGIVVYHDAYGYLAQAFGLNILGSVRLGDASDPGAARLAAIRANLEASGARCIFPEVNHPDAYVALVTEGHALRIGGPLDPAGSTHEPGPGLYEATMLDLAQTIADCIAGP